jgi:hypothetical protein
MDCTAASRSVILTTPSGVNAPGWEFTVVKSDSSANIVTVGGGTINGDASYNIRRQWEGVRLIWINASSVWLALPFYAEFPTSTVMLFRQTAAPVGWTKYTDAYYSNKALRTVVGTVTDGAGAAFTSVFAARTIAQANLPNVNFSAVNLSAATTTTISQTGATKGGTLLSTTVRNDGSAAGPVGDGNISQSASSSTVITGSVPSGGSGTEMDFAVAYLDLIVAFKT